jgi:hypothetical protein
MERPRTPARSFFTIKGLLLFWCFISLVPLYGQDSLVVPAKNSIRGELFGAGGVYSINYERIYNQSHLGAYASRIGFAYLREPASEGNGFNRWNGYFVTGTQSVLFGKRRSRFEPGIAVTFYRSDYTAESEDYYAEPSSTNLLAGILLGYRYFARRNFNFGITAYGFRGFSWYASGTGIPDYQLTGGISIGKGF